MIIFSAEVVIWRIKSLLSLHPYQHDHHDHHHHGHQHDSHDQEHHGKDHNHHHNHNSSLAEKVEIWRTQFAFSLQTSVTQTLTSILISIIIVNIILIVILILIVIIIIIIVIIIIYINVFNFVYTLCQSSQYIVSTMFQSNFLVGHLKFFDHSKSNFMFHIAADQK